VRAPDDDVLRTMAEADARRLAANQIAAPAAGRPPSNPGAAEAPPAPHGATIMLNHGHVPPQPPPGQRGGLAATMPLTGPSPLCPDGHRGEPMPAGPAAQHGMGGAPQITGPTPMHPMAGGMGPGGTQGMPPMPYAHAHALDSMSPAPAYGGPNAPKRSPMMLYLGIAFGTLLLIGLAAIAAVVVAGKKDVATADADASAVAATAPPEPTPTPEPAPTNEPTNEPTPTNEPAPPASTVAEATPEPPPAVDPAPPAKEPTPAASVTATPTKEPAPAKDPTPTKDPTPVVPTAAPAKDAGDPNAFNEAVARQRLAGLNSVLVFCKKEGGVTGPGMATVTFAPEGTVTTVTLDPAYSGTPAGDCVANYFRRAKVNPFQGGPRAVTHAFEVPSK
jgi:outer membrane biosynthesis protein TonB